MDFFAIALGVVLILLFGYVFFEVHYFLRSLLCVVLASICKKKVFILDDTSVKGFCLTTDIDSLLTHMNNARFVRELDFAKMDFLYRTGLYKTIKSFGGSFCMGATTIRYRRFIKLFSFYVITTKIIYWDHQNIYMEHRFMSPKDKFVNAIVLCKTRITSCNVDEIMNKLISDASDVENKKMEKPELPIVLKLWLESNEISSALLRDELTI